MTVNPNGLPAWSRTAAFTTYDGDLNKRNYQDVGFVNPETDFSAEAFARLVEDVAMMSRTAPFAIITYQNNDNSPANPTLISYTGMNGVGAAFCPTLTRTGNGGVTIAFETSYDDSYSVSQAFSIHHYCASAHGLGNLSATCSLTDAQTLFVQAYTADDGTSAFDTIVTVRVW